ncbi:MAG: type III pantothenate kinase [Erysipelotrichaceae bacterium]|nr:type III pantothenate kinase [Erysipelotrichaceae bacterium]
MLLTIDLGNTSIKLALWENGRQECFAVYDSKQDDYKTIIQNFLYRHNLKEELIEDTVVSSVVPKASEILKKDILSLTGKNAIFINPRENYGITIDTPNVDEVGSDLLVMCAYAYHVFHDELLVVSLGTASVISHVTKDGVFKHCIIAPGFGKVAGTLWDNAAKLPEFEIKRTESFLANTTIDAMNVGVYQGFVGLLRYLLVGIRAELGTRPKVVACGGFGKQVVKDVREIEYYEADMVTVGLNYIYSRYIRK